jgi:hypothetical protein
MTIFLDTNFLISLIVDTEFTERAKQIVKKYIDEDLVVSVTVVEETLFILKKLTRRSNEEIVREVEKVFNGLEIYVLEHQPYAEFLNVFRRHKLLPNDALIAATCKHHGIKKIATFDEDFRRVDFLEVIEL